MRPAAKEVAQDDRVVVLRVASGEEESDRPIVERGTERFPGFRASTKLELVALSERGPPIGAMVEPLPQLPARCDLGGPGHACEVGLTETPRPEPVDEEGTTERLRGALIHALDRDRDGRCLLGSCHD